jgi:hypothetical protein
MLPHRLRLSYQGQLPLEQSAECLKGEKVLLLTLISSNSTELLVNEPLPGASS